MKSLSLKLLPLFIALCYFFTKESDGFAQTRIKSPSELKLREEEIRKQMIQISKELGVTCTDCHSTSNWKDSSKPYFKVALEHMKIVDLLKQGGMNGKNKTPEASCYMCHRGQVNYNWKSK
jgi:hypothetical protein